MSQSKKIIGIIGGMGPQASIRFYELLIRISEEKYGARKNEDYPHILLSNLPVPDLIDNDKHRKKAVGMLKKEMAKLSRAGADFLVVACNTMHHYLSEAETKVPVLSMVESVCERISEHGYTYVGVLGTPSTIRSGLYTAPLHEKGIGTFVPSSPDILQLGKIIKSIIAGAYGRDEQKALHLLLQKQIESGVQAIILGCTELPLVLSSEHAPVALFDSLHILAEDACEKIYKKTRLR